MPAAAVIPAPIAYIKVAAVKKLVVGFLTLMRLTRYGYVCVCRVVFVILLENVSRLFIESIVHNLDLLL